MADELKRVGLVFKADGAADFQKTMQQVNTAVQENSNFDTYNSLTPNWYYKVLR